MVDLRRFVNLVIGNWALAILLGLWPAVAPAQPAALKTYNAPHYAVHTDLPRDQAEVFALHMERVYANYVQRFKDFRARDDKPMELYLFGDQSSYATFLQLHNVPAEGSGGMFFINPKIQGLATFTRGRSRAETFSVLQHEGFHQFAFNYIGPELPIWLNEGLAQYFEDGILIDSSMTLGVADADRIERVRSAINNNTALPIADVLNISEKDWAQTLNTQPDKAALLYAQAWSMTYFLLNVNNGAYQSKLTEYLKLVSAGHPGHEAFGSAFGVSDLSPMDKSWRQYALQQQPDAINAVLTRLEFFAAALSYMTEQNEKMPRSFGDLRRHLRSRGFTLTRTSPGVRIVYSATDDELFRFKRSDGHHGQFRLYEPARTDLPPRISALGMSPEPTLVWYRSEDGELISDIEFR
ncbi:MAG: DUF1570 domain-containing protein [Phycisphaeraceae bacterium]|nr:DUF1570 domain-containing protein [Phycisphaeraceae bacterium]